MIGVDITSQPLMTARLAGPRTQSVSRRWAAALHFVTGAYVALTFLEVLVLTSVGTHIPLPEWFMLPLVPVPLLMVLFRTLSRRKRPRFARREESAELAMLCTFLLWNVAGHLVLGRVTAAGIVTGVAFTLFAAFTADRLRFGDTVIRRAPEFTADDVLQVVPVYALGSPIPARSDRRSGDNASRPVSGDPAPQSGM